MNFAFKKLVPMTGLCVGFDPFGPAPSQAMPQGMPQGLPQGMPQGQGQGQQVSMPVASSVVPGVSTGMTHNPNDPSGFGQTQPSTGGASPLDKYNQMLDNKGKSEEGQSKPATAAEEQQQMIDLINLGYGDFLSSGRQVQKSFTSGIDSSKIQSALSGNVDDFMGILQQVAINTFAAASYGSSKLAGNYANQRLSGFEKGLDERFQKFEQSRASHNINALGAAKGVDFNAPALRGMRDMALDMFQRNYPEAGREEIANMAMDYLQAMAGHIAGGNGSQEGKQQDEQARGYGDLFGMNNQQ